MQKNVGTMDAIVRITCGLAGLAWATSRMVKYPRRGLPVGLAMLCALRVAEGVTRFCPILHLRGKNTLDKGTGNDVGTKLRPVDTSPERT